MGESRREEPPRAVETQERNVSETLRKAGIAKHESRETELHRDLLRNGERGVLTKQVPA